MFFHVTPSSPFWTLEGLFELKRRPSRALDSPCTLLLELQRNRDTTRRAALGAEESRTPSRATIANLGNLGHLLKLQLFAVIKKWWPPWPLWFEHNLFIAGLGKQRWCAMLSLSFAQSLKKRPLMSSSAVVSALTRSRSSESQHYHHHHHCTSNGDVCRDLVCRANLHVLTQELYR